MDTVIDSNTLRLVRVFDAPRERVFDAWAVQEQFAQWMCPPGVMIDEYRGSRIPTLRQLSVLMLHEMQPGRSTNAGIHK